MAVGRPGVPSWIDTAGTEQDQRSGAPDPSAQQEWATAGRVGGSSRIQAILSRALAYGLWIILALALVLGLVNCAGSPSAAPQSEQPQPPAQPVPPPSGCAELLVAGWLAGDTALLANLPGLPRSQPEPGQRQAVHTYTAAVTPGEAAWGYLVGAQVQVRDETAQWQPAGMQFFMVTMIPAGTAGAGCNGWQPAALPAQVPAPQLAGEAQLPYPVMLPASGTELSQTIEAFFTGLLTGGESLERYVAPGVHIPVLAPPPYQQVSVTELRTRAELVAPVPPDGTVVQLLVTVATDADHLPLVYPVTVAVRGGRWEVVSIDPLVGAAVIDPTSGTSNVAPPATNLNPPAESTNGG